MEGFVSSYQCKKPKRVAMFLFGLAPPESLVCITGTLRWTGRGWRSRVSGANAFMLLIQLLSGVIPACQFVWAADLHNEFILATVLHTLPPSLPSLSLSSTPLSVLQLLPLLSPSLSLSLSLFTSPCSPPPPPLHSPHPPLIKFTKCPESRVFKCKRASFPNWRHSPSMPHTQQPQAPLRGFDKRWMDGDDGKRMRESVMEMERGVGILGSAACLK